MNDKIKKIFTFSVISAVSATALGCSTTNSKVANNIDKSMAEFVSSINNLDYVDTATSSDTGLAATNSEILQTNDFRGTNLENTSNEKIGKIVETAAFPQNMQNKNSTYDTQNMDFISATHDSQNPASQLNMQNANYNNSNFARTAQNPNFNNAYRGMQPARPPRDPQGFQRRGLNQEFLNSDLMDLDIENTITRPSERDDLFKLFVLSDSSYISLTSDDNSAELGIKLKFSTDKIEETSEEIEEKINTLILKRSILMIYVNEIYNGNVTLSDENKVAINAYVNVIKENTSFLNGNRGMVKNQLGLASDLLSSEANENLINFYIIKSGEALETRANKLDSSISAIDSIIQIVEENLTSNSSYYNSNLTDAYQSLISNLSDSESLDTEAEITASSTNEEIARKIACTLNFCELENSTADNETKTDGNENSSENNSGSTLIEVVPGENDTNAQNETNNAILSEQNSGIQTLENSSSSNKNSNKTQNSIAANKNKNLTDNQNSVRNSIQNNSNSTNKTIQNNANSSRNFVQKSIKNRNLVQNSTNKAQNFVTEDSSENQKENSKNAVISSNSNTNTKNSATKSNNNLSQNKNSNSIKRNQTRRANMDTEKDNSPKIMRADRTPETASKEEYNSKTMSANSPTTNVERVPFRTTSTFEN